MFEVVVYTKDGCHTCERVIAELLKLSSERSLEISVKDISEDSHLFESYKNIIPVIAVDGKVRLAGATLTNPNTLKDILEALLPTA